MKSSTATYLTVAVLLAAAMLCPVLLPGAADENAAVPEPDSSVPRPSARPQTESSSHDPEAAQKAMTRRVHTLLLNANWMERSRNLLLLTERLQPEEWPLAMKSLHELGMSRNGDEEILLMTAWTEVDPRAAAEYPKSPLHAVVPMWMTLDSKAAWEWIMSPKNQDNRPGLIGLALETLVKTDLPRVTRELAAMPNRSDILNDIARRRIVGMPKGTSRQWLDSMSDQKLKDEALFALLKNLSDSRIDEKFELVHDQPAMREKVTTDLYESWAHVDEAAAIASSESLEPGKERDLALAGIVHHLSDRSPARALELIDRNPGPRQESLLNWWISYIVLDDPALAISQVHRIEREDIREETYRHVITTWLEKDGAAAREWLATHDLPPSLKQEFKPD